MEKVVKKFEVGDTIYFLSTSFYAGLSIISEVVESISYYVRGDESIYNTDRRKYNTDKYKVDENWAFASKQEVLDKLAEFIQTEGSVMGIEMQTVSYVPIGTTVYHVSIDTLKKPPLLVTLEEYEIGALSILRDKKNKIDNVIYNLNGISPGFRHKGVSQEGLFFTPLEAVDSAIKRLNPEQYVNDWEDYLRIKTELDILRLRVEKEGSVA